MVLGFLTFGTLKRPFDIKILDLENKNLENDLKNLITQKINLKTLHKTPQKTQKPTLILKYTPPVYIFGNITQKSLNQYQSHEFWYFLKLTI